MAACGALRSFCVRASGRRSRQCPVGAHAVSVGFADFPAVLARWACRRTRCTHFVRYAQTGCDKLVFDARLRRAAHRAVLLSDPE